MDNGAPVPRVGGHLATVAPGKEWATVLHRVGDDERVRREGGATISAHKML